MPGDGVGAREWASCSGGDGVRNGCDVQGKRNIKLVLEYDGAGYHGWQRQNGMLTVQEVLESRLAVMLGGVVGVRASGRTDAGVHAKGQVANFYTRSRLSPEEIQRGLNSLLPPDIVIVECKEADLSFHARFSASSKVYEYRILNRPTPSALERMHSWHIRQGLAAGPMRACLETLIGVHDFSAFMAAGSSVSSTERHMLRTRLENPDPVHLVFSFEADGFLRYMVRNLVGTLVEVGRGKRTPEEFSRILAGRDRKSAGMTAPAHGLYLLAVHYDNKDELPRERGVEKQ